MSKLNAALRLIRPLNGIMAALSVIPATTLACGTITMPWRESGLIFCLVSFGYAVNDIFDLRADQINRPKRAIPSGDLSTSNAWLTAVIFLIAGSGLLIGANTLTALYYVGVALLLYWYAVRISSLLMIGNVLVALLCSSVFALGALRCTPGKGAIGMIITCGVLTFLYHLGREIVKDIEDVSGDSSISRSTLPLKWGVNMARLIATLVFALMIAVTYGAWAVLDLSGTFLIAISLGVNLPLALIFVIYWNRDAAGGAKATSIALKVVMLPALVAVLLAGVN